jgi:signal transduction histidine kinase
MQDEIKILLVDDEPRNLDTLEAILDDPSYHLLRAGDADSALRRLLEHDVAAIVLDIKMPGINGFELAELIKGTKRFRQIPIVFLTAYMVDDKDVLTGYGAGAVDYLTKPVNPLILRHKVAVFAELFRKSRALADLNEKLEVRVRERTADLEHANRMKDEFLATISHELRTPLNAMLGWSVLLRHDPHNVEKLRRGLEVIERNARAQERLVTDLLDVSRIVSGKLRLKMTEFPLANAIRAAVDVVRHAAEAKGIRLVLDLDPAMGMTIGDAGRLQQVVWNLLANAIRYTSPSGRVTITTQRRASEHVVRVEDTGVGIPVEHLPHIFEPFRQVDSSTTRAHGGLGLGLALVRHLVEAHGGTVDAQSDGAGRGAVFTMTLPVRAVGLTEVDWAEAEAGTGTTATPSSSPWGEKLANTRVLVVEDDPDSLDVVRVMLEDAGACVATAAGATEALRAVDASPAFDVIVSDIGLPGMDGYEFMRRIRAGSPGREVPAIALTAYTRGEDVERAVQAGYQEHLPKPVDSRKLIEVVKTLVEANTTRSGSAREPHLAQ